MTTTTAIFTQAALDAAVVSKHVNVERHSVDSDVVLLDYSQKCQFSRAWNGVTLNSRGLIFRESTGEILARPFKKFFNFDEPTADNPPVGVMVRSPKFDGSLGIVYRLNGEFFVSTRGSFESTQALYASARLREYIDNDQVFSDELHEIYNNNQTILVEIIFPENRIVVDYSGLDDLVLLDILDNDTNKTVFEVYDSILWPIKADKALIPEGFYDTIASDIPEGEEGFVLYWPSNALRLKVKSAEYVHLHSILTNTSSRDLWRNMAVHACKDFISEPKDWGTRLGMNPNDARKILAGHEDWLSTLINSVPDEFYAWVSETMDDINKNVQDYIRKTRVIATCLMEEPDARVRYEKATKFGNEGLVALKYAATGNYETLICTAWKNAFPAYQSPFSGGTN